MDDLAYFPSSCLRKPLRHSVLRPWHSTSSKHVEASWIRLSLSRWQKNSHILGHVQCRFQRSKSMDENKLNADETAKVKFIDAEIFWVYSIRTPVIMRVKTHTLDIDDCISGR